jgi:hypothetical protein
VSTAVNVRPNGFLHASAGMTIGGGAASHNAAQSDNSDATYSILTGSLQDLSLAVTSAAPPALAQIRLVSVLLRAANASGDGVIDCYIQTGTSPGLITQTYLGRLSATNGLGASIATFTVGTASIKSNGTPFSVADVSPLYSLTLLGTSPLGTNIYESYVIITYNQAPVATITQPTPGGQFLTAIPPFIWTYSDADGDAQERYQVWVYTAAYVAAHGAGSFDPTAAANQSSASWYSGEVFSSANTVTGGSLLNGSYSLYVRVADQGSSGRYGPIDTKAFTVLAPVPAAPTGGVTADQLLQRNVIAVVGHGNLLSAEAASFEGGSTGGYTGANATLANSTAQASHGSHSLRLTSVASGNMSAASPLIPVAPGTQVTAGAYFRSAVSARSVRADVTWYNTALGVISTSAGTAVSDSTSAFTPSTASLVAPALTAWMAVTPTVLATGAANEQHYVDQCWLALGSGIVWSLSDPTVTYSVFTESSDDGGVTWQPNRADGVVPDQIGTYQFYDYEARPDTLRQYRVSFRATTASGDTPTSTATVIGSSTLCPYVTWLKDPLDPTKNIVLSLTAPLTWTRPENSSADWPLGRTTAMVITDGVRKGITAKLTVHAYSTSYAALMAALDSQRTMLLQFPWFTENHYGRIWGALPITLENDVKVDFEFIETDPPAIS